MGAITGKLVHCTERRFRKVAPFNCDAAKLSETIANCSAIEVTLPAGKVNIAYEYVQPGVVQLVAVQGAVKRGSVIDYLPWLESRLNGHALQFVTRRAGLVRRMEKRGYKKIDQVMDVSVMRKEFS